MRIIRHTLILCIMMCCLWVQIPLPPQDERKKVVEDVDKDRRHAIDAAVVRTMKSRKVLSHQQVEYSALPSAMTPGHGDKLFTAFSSAESRRLRDLANVCQ